MKKLGKLFTVFFLFGVILFVSRFYLSSHFPYTHDGENHLARFANYKIAVRELQIPPRIAPVLHNHYGYPVFNFNYPLANILSLPFSFLRVSYQTTFGLLVIAGLILGAIGMNRWLAEFTEDTKVKALCIVVWLLQPYLISLLLYRGNIGEVLAYSLIPWMFVVVHAVKQKMDSLQLVGWVLLVSAFALSHNITVVFSVPFVLLYAGVVFGRDFTQWKRLLLIGLLSVGFTLWFWLPAIVEIPATVVAESQNQIAFADHFVTIRQLLWSSYEFGYSLPGRIDSLGLKTGFLTVVLVLAQLGLGTFAIFTKKSSKVWRIVTLLSLFAVFCVVLQLNLSEPLWQSIPVLRFMQFPWRWGLFFSALSIPVIAFALARLPKQVVLLVGICVLISFSEVSKIAPVDTFSKSNEDYEFFTLSSSTQNENMAKGFTYNAIGDWKPTAVVLESGKNATIETASWSGREHIYTVVTTDAITLVEPVMVFPGWETTVNGTRIEYVDNEKVKGRLAYTLKPGEYAVQTEFTQNTPARILGNTVFFVTLGSVVYLLLVRRKCEI
ncbi:MAG: hypothetical protein H6773_01370 [Pseudomonadales bacterium]|nr:hypothetical protein [Candidatus Woesebacteria bacterium]MCB9800806.1 hypothetical protein [Pseudomonadales bacterium]